ncbi:hypothetical protein H312_02849 [Anncaliia algerae PRA339]|uniref:Uncharacterized protein n=1 Tax=Anncaliia algerae PRA339 TaxID=1288291 RepID=A0A059EYG3_9MICR|nr:hypothetical protein H312_02849 [Anncaliia algerae PRA339]
MMQDNPKKFFALMAITHRELVQKTNDVLSAILWLQEYLPYPGKNFATLAIKAK